MFSSLKLNKVGALCAFLSSIRECSSSTVMVAAFVCLTGRVLCMFFTIMGYWFSMFNVQ